MVKNNRFGLQGAALQLVPFHGGKQAIEALRHHPEIFQPQFAQLARAQDHLRGRTRTGDHHLAGPQILRQSPVQTIANAIGHPRDGPAPPLRQPFAGGQQNQV